jgi:hypothetical protein
MLAACKEGETVVPKREPTGAYFVVGCLTISLAISLGVGLLAFAAWAIVSAVRLALG